MTSILLRPAFIDNFTENTATHISYCITMNKNVSSVV